MDNPPLAAALGAGGGGGEHAHGRLPPDLDRPGAVAVRAHLRRRAGGTAVAVAGVAGLIPLHGDCLLTAEGRLLEADGDGHADALAPLGGVGIGAPPAAEAAAEKAAEDVPQVAEVEAPVESAAEAPGAEVGVNARMAVLVVPGLLVRVGEDLIGLVDLLELLLRRLVPRIQVRVILPGHFFIGLFDLILRGSPGNPQDLVVIAFLFCHRITNFSIRNGELGIRNCGIRSRRMN